MKFTPEPAEVLFNLLPEGDYDFEIVKAEEEIGKKSGKEQIKLWLKVNDAYGKEKIINDWLGAAFKIYNFCNAIEKPNLYDNGEINAGELVGIKGRAKIKVDKNSDPTYPDKNAVAKYLKPSKEEVGVVDPTPFDDLIPF